MYKEIRKRAEKKVEAKMALYTTGIVFFFTSIVLLMLSFYLPGAAFWLRLPIPLLVMVLGVQYLNVYGLPKSGAYSEDWREDEIEKEMIKLYRQEKEQLPPPDDLSDEDVVELKELERLKAKWEWGKDYV